MQERVPLSKLVDEVRTPEAQRRLERLRSTDLNYYDPDAELEAKEGPEPPKIASIEYTPVERYEPSEEERELIKRLLQEGERVQAGRLRAGPHHDTFLQFMKLLQGELDTIASGLTPEHLAPYDYQSDSVRNRHSTLSSESYIKLERLARWRLDYLDATADAKIHPATATQIIPPDTLDVPPFSRAADEWINYRSGQACTSACFKMIFQAIADHPLSHTAIGDALIAKYRTPIVHDEILVRTLKTPTFQQLSKKVSATVEYIGADFEQIQEAATKIRQRFDDVQVFCMINLSSTAAGRRTWHTGILLAADAQKVVYHDPSGVNGGAFSVEERAAFARRWVQSYNRARLIIAAPPDKS